jgi:hypothetical protein
VVFGPGSLFFGDQPATAGSETQTVELRNTGEAPVVLGEFDIVGDGGSDFRLKSEGCSKGQLRGGESCTLLVEFAPKAMGSRVGTLRLVQSDKDVMTVGLEGHGTAARLLGLPAAPSFSNQAVGTISGVQTVTLANAGGPGTGSLPVTVSRVRVVGPNAGDFLVVGESCTDGSLAAAATCAVSVRFAPTATGSRSASLRVSDDALGNPHDVALTGTGTDPAAGPPGPTGGTGPPGAGGAAGADGAAGSPGADGAAGSPGAVGPGGEQGAPGSNGAQGPKGDSGVQGPPGSPGRNGLVTCKVAKAKKGKVKVICTVKLVAASAKGATVRARLSRNGRVFARGAGAVRRGQSRLGLRSERGVPRGSYRLTLAFKDTRGHRTTATVALVLG